MSTPTDVELLEAWRGGDASAGRALFARHFDGVYRFFRNKVDDAAEDLTQQTFEAIVAGRDQFRGEATFRTYLFTVARKKLYSHLRTRHRRGPKVPLDALSVADVAGPSPSRAAAVRQEQRLLLQALRRLPVQMQVALELFYWEGLSVTEVAAVVEVPVGTIKSRLQRARARIDEIIAELAASDSLRRSTLDGFERWARDLRGHMGPRGDG